MRSLISIKSYVTEKDGWITRIYNPSLLKNLCIVHIYCKGIESNELPITLQKDIMNFFPVGENYMWMRINNSRYLNVIQLYYGFLKKSNEIILKNENDDTLLDYFYSEEKN